MSKKTETPKVFVVNNSSFLGTRNENIITGLNITSIKVDNEDFANLFKAETTGELLTLEVGANTDVQSKELTVREILDYEAVKAEYAAAKDMADAVTLNNVFDSFRKK